MPCPPDCPDVSSIFPINIKTFKPIKIDNPLSGGGGQCDPLGDCTPGRNTSGTTKNELSKKKKKQNKKIIKNTYQSDKVSASGVSKRKLRKAEKQAQFQLLVDKGIVTDPNIWKGQKSQIKKAFKEGDITRKTKRQLIKSHTAIDQNISTKKS